jgi:hypothetical protein
MAGRGRTQSPAELRITPVSGYRTSRIIDENFVIFLPFIEPIERTFLIF